ncbi:hypothetical protein V8C86DRAFT_2500032 [Haematococcus lacustris]
MSSMSVDGSSYAADAAGSVNGPTIRSRFSPSAPPVKHPLPSSGTVLLPYELDRSFQCVQSSLQVLCNDAEVWGGSALCDALVLRKLPSRASAAFSDGFVKPSIVQEYQRRYEELPSEQAWDADHCIAMFLDIVRDDLSDPVLLKQHVQGVQLGDVGDSGRTKAPRSLKARMAPQLVRMAEEGHLSRLSASSQPIDPALYEQFRLFMASPSPAAAPPLRAHTVVQPRSGPSWGRPRCDHCGKDGHTEERCFSKHPELRQAQWGQPGPAHSLAAVPGVGEDEDEDEDAALHSLTNMPITSVSTPFDAMRYAIALAAAAERPLSFAPGGATTHALPASRVAPRDTSSSSSSSSSKVPMQLQGQADITDI